MIHCAADLRIRQLGNFTSTILRKTRAALTIEIEEIQRDLDRFLVYYNLERTHQGYRLKGRTPAQALREALDRDELSELDYAYHLNLEETADIETSC